jgi:hypothetical protein
VPETWEHALRGRRSQRTKQPDARPRHLMAQTNSTPSPAPLDAKLRSELPALLGTLRRRRITAASLLAGLVGVAALVYAWYEQYSVDAETTLLPWLIRRGWVLYADLIDQHGPLLPWLLVPFDGDPGLPLRVLIVALRAVTLLLTYLVARRLCGAWGGLVALSGAALWAIGANAAHLWYDGALAPVYLGILLLLVGQHKYPAKIGDSARVAAEIPLAVALGGLLAVAMLLKQHAVIAVPAVLLALAWDRPGRGRRLLAFASGVLVPIALVGVYFISRGAGQPAAYWTIAYSLEGNYATAAGLAQPPGDTLWLLAAFAPMVALILAGTTPGARHVAGRYYRVLIAGSGLLLAATLPLWPRYGRFHLQAAIPLLAVTAGATVVILYHELRQRKWQTRLLSAMATLLLVVYIAVGVSEGLTSFRIQSQLPPVSAPYASTLPPLANWVGRHTARDAPIVLYGVDELLYRMLAHPPPRPWVPQLTWILSAQDAGARWWAGVVRERPSVALVAATWWDSGVPASNEPSPGWLRANYHADARFVLVPYPGAPSVTVVALLLNDGGP